MREFLQKNWYLLLLMLVFFGTGFYGMIRPAPSEPPRELTPSQLPSGAVNPNRTMPRSPWQEKTRSERADEDIAKIEAQIESDPHDPKIPMKLQKLGILYHYAKKDYSTAASYYEDVLDRFPDHPGNDPLYLRLAKCYEKLGDRDLARDAYRRAVENLSPDHEWHKFAAKKLAEEY